MSLLKAKLRLAESFLASADHSGYKQSCFKSDVIPTAIRYLTGEILDEFFDPITLTEKANHRTLNDSNASAYKSKLIASIGALASLISPELAESSVVEAINEFPRYWVRRDEAAEAGVDLR